MADPLLQLGSQAEATPSPRDRPAVRRPWHPSQGGAPWDTENFDAGESLEPLAVKSFVALDSSWNHIYPMVRNEMGPMTDCVCPACRRAAKR